MIRNHQQSQPISLEIDGCWNGTRLDKVIACELHEVSRSQVQKWIESGAVQINGENAGLRDKVYAGSRVDIIPPLPEVIAENTPQDIEIDIIYQDEYLALINKAKGMVVHPGAGNEDGTLMNAVLHHFPETQQLTRGGIVHRLDKDTSGLMVVAKTEATRLCLTELLANHSILREYEAIVVGTPSGGGTVNQPIKRDARNRKRMAIHPNGKEAVTHYRVLERLFGYSRLRLRLETGRTHQIRIHMKHLGHVLVGDRVYGYRPKIDKKMSEESLTLLRAYAGQALHSRRIRFVHPITRAQLNYKVAMPEDMKALLASLRTDEEWQDDEEWGDYEALWSEEGMWLE